MSASETPGRPPHQQQPRRAPLSPSRAKRRPRRTTRRYHPSADVERRRRGRPDLTHVSLPIARVLEELEQGT